jgi:hypothetical protein
MALHTSSLSLSARDIAHCQAALSALLSADTARHHAQSVLERIGTHSRKAMGLRFLEGEPLPSRSPSLRTS